jgi:superfamily II DNA or RNA helicase
VLVVAVPYQVLGEQWFDVMNFFSMSPVRCFYSQNAWLSSVQAEITDFNAGVIKFLALIVVNETLKSEKFQECMARISPDKLFFVGDECHRHASAEYNNIIPKMARFRIGLSATPWNPGREFEKSILTSYYGPVVSIYSLQDALADDVLCPYIYDVVPCEFEEDEAALYLQITNELNLMVARTGQAPTPNQLVGINILAARRNRLVGSLRKKYYVLQEHLRNFPPKSHALFYCGEGSHPIDVGDADAERNIEKITSLISSSGLSVGRITAAETSAERKRILASFDDGWIGAVAAIKVLDEGFDLPSCRIAYLLASSTSYRQFVQRRGRVLRRAPGKRSATIIDFLAVPTRAQYLDNKELWKRHLISEYRRIKEFIELSGNKDEAELKLAAISSAIGVGPVYYDIDKVIEEEIYE